MPGTTAGRRRPGQAGSRSIRISVHSMARASSICRRPASELPMPATSLSASAACMLPTMPTSGANTPIVEQATSSNATSGGKTQA
jgi:hypothetical protein